MEWCSKLLHCVLPFFDLEWLPFSAWMASNPRVFPSIPVCPRWWLDRRSLSGIYLVMAVSHFRLFTFTQSAAMPCQQVTSGRRSSSRRSFSSKAAWGNSTLGTQDAAQCKDPWDHIVISNFWILRRFWFQFAHFFLFELTLHFYGDLLSTESTQRRGVGAWSGGLGRGDRWR